MKSNTLGDELSLLFAGLVRLHWMASLKALWHDLHPPQVEVQLTLDTLKYRSKEPDARPARPVLWRRLRNR